VIDIAATYTGQTSIVDPGNRHDRNLAGDQHRDRIHRRQNQNRHGDGRRDHHFGDRDRSDLHDFRRLHRPEHDHDAGNDHDGRLERNRDRDREHDRPGHRPDRNGNRITIGGTATHPTVDISVAYVGQTSITTLGTVTAGSWTASSISTTYTDAKVKTVTGTANRLTIGGTATDPTFDVSTSYVGQATITTLGTITTGTWAATAITVDKGGTNLTSFTIGDMIYASGATTLSKLAIGTAAQILVTNGGATAPAWHTLVTADITDLTSATTGITKVGTVTTGVWNAGIINGIYGGTGVNNGSSTITLGGSLTTSGAFALTLTVTAGTNVTLPTSGTLVTTAVTSLASLTSVGGAFAISGAFTGATTGAFSSTLSTSQLTITDTASRIIPGATSLSLRNNANNADNILITDAGAITVRSTIGGVTTISGTTATFTNLGGTLSTAAQPNDHVDGRSRVASCDVARDRLGRTDDHGRGHDHGRRWAT
jgi:hypothetical protein